MRLSIRRAEAKSRSASERPATKRCLKYPTKVWVSRERKSLMFSSHSAGPEQRKIFPVSDSVYRWPTVSFVGTAAESTWRARLGREQHSTCICRRSFPSECPLRVRLLVPATTQEFLRGWAESSRL